METLAIKDHKIAKETAGQHRTKQHKRLILLSRDNQCIASLSTTHLHHSRVSILNNKSNM